MESFYDKFRGLLFSILNRNENKEAGTVPFVSRSGFQEKNKMNQNCINEADLKRISQN